jgi:hypothetical protein
MPQPASRPKEKDPSETLLDDVQGLWINIAHVLTIRDAAFASIRPRSRVP